MQRWLLLSTLIAGLVLLGLGTLRGEVLALAIPLLIYAGAPVLYFLSITVLRSGRKRDQEYADFT